MLRGLLPQTGVVKTHTHKVTATGIIVRSTSQGFAKEQIPGDASTYHRSKLLLLLGCVFYVECQRHGLFFTPSWPGFAIHTTNRRRQVVACSGGTPTRADDSVHALVPPPNM